MPINTLFKRVNLILIMLLLISGLQINTAPVSAAPASAGLSVESLLKPDGTLNTQGGVSGSLSLAGWDVNLDPARGPVFAPSGAGSSFAWTPLSTGTNNNVYAIAVSGENVYVGGNFTNVGDVLASKIAKWNTTTSRWSALSADTFDAEILAIGIRDNGHIYVGGGFNTVGGDTVNHIAKWNGTSWTSNSHFE